MITATRYRAMAEINRQAKLGAEIARAQSEISTGKRIDRASDDPIAAGRIVEIRRAQADQLAWARNIETARSVAAQVDTALGGVANIFNRVKELALAGATESVSTADRAAIVQELASLRTQIGNMATTATATGQPLFPTDAPLRISTSPTQRLPATAQRSTVFDEVALGGGTDTLDSVIEDVINAVSIDDIAMRRTAADASLADVDIAIRHVTSQHAAQGIRAAQLDDAANSIAESGIQLAEERSSLEDTDVAAAIMRLNAKTLTLQAAQAAFAKVNRNTLFDFLS